LDASLPGDRVTFVLRARPDSVIESRLEQKREVQPGMQVVNGLCPVRDRLVVQSRGESVLAETGPDVHGGAL